MKMSWLFGLLRKLLLKVKYVSLVNLIANREVVKELVAKSFAVEAIQQELQTILQPDVRQRMLQGYEEVCRRLGDKNAPEEAAKIITKNR